MNNIECTDCHMIGQVESKGYFKSSVIKNSNYVYRYQCNSCGHNFLMTDVNPLTNSTSHCVDIIAWLNYSIKIFNKNVE